MYSNIPGAFSLPLADARQGTKVHYRWAQWHHQQRHSVTCIAVFRKGELRRVVHEYRSQRFCVVAAKLLAHGWEEVLDHEGEMGHAH